MYFIRNDKLCDFFILARHPPLDSKVFLILIAVINIHISLIAFGPLRLSDWMETSPGGVDEPQIRNPMMEKLSTFLLEID